MAIIEVRVCDTCEAQGDITTWTISRDQETRHVDLCDRHGEALARLFGGAEVPKASTPARSGRGQIRHMKITTPEELASLHGGEKQKAPHGH